MLYAGSLKSEERKEIMPVESNVEFVASPRNPRQGYLLFTQGRTLATRTFDLTTLTAGAAITSLGDAVTSAGTLDAAVSTAEFSATGSLLAFRPMDHKSGITVVRNWMNRLSQQH
jgi:hypothetical protein